MPLSKNIKRKKLKSARLKVSKRSAGTSSREYERAIQTARYYGFFDAPRLEVQRADLQDARSFKESHMKEVHPFRENESEFAGYLEEKISILRSYLEKRMAHLSSPTMIYYEGPLAGNPHIRRIKNEKTFNLEILGSSKSIADAMIMETACVILKEQYHLEELSVYINSIGDKESINKFARELTLYYRKNWKDLPAHCRTTFKKDVFDLFLCKEEKCLELRENAPKPMSFLSEASRIHFKEVLEYLESLSIPYVIEHSLLGSRSFCSGTIFEIRGSDSDHNGNKTLAIGERYNGLAKKIWAKKDVPAMGVAILIHPDHLKKRTKQKKDTKAKFYFIQLGFDAKLKSLKIIEMLRQAKIPVQQALSKDKLTGQIASAEKMKIPYIIIMGQKEVLEESVVVRSMNTREQETVKVDQLIKYLKKLK
jgi:histidyl-tRNA synthetase